jgi:hypothetical protein
VVLATRLTPVIVPPASATVPSVAFTTGAPDGRMGMTSRPAGSGQQVEIEAADDFTLSTDFDITSAIFTGLVPTAMPLNGVQDVRIEVYHVFPTDSVTPSGHVPTRVSSPADAEFDSRDSASASLASAASVIASSFNVANTVVNGINPKPNQTTGGEGSASGEEVQFNVTFSPALTLLAGQYFFVPKVQLSSGNFL